VSVIGRRDGIPDPVLQEMDKTIELSKQENSGHRGSAGDQLRRSAELLDAVRRAGEPGRPRRASPEDLSEEMISQRLYTAGMEDPDLLIRTAGEMRISNFLLWQISYAELWVTDRCWPEFREPDLHQAIRDFAGRQRRFGGLAPAACP